MNPGPVNGWWVVATAATLIFIDLASASDIEVSAFWAFVVFFGPLVALVWWGIKGSDE